MSTTYKPEHPQEFYAPGWHGEARTPVVDGKYYDRATGELRVASGGEYGGPPEVDIIISSIHEDTTQCRFRASRPFPIEAILYHIMQVVHERKLEMDSLTATPYAIRVTLAHQLTADEFSDVSMKMANGIWDQRE